MTTLTEQLQRLGRTPDDLQEAVRGKPEAVLARRPGADAWAAKEIVCHFRDTEELFIGRFQTILANDEPKLLPMDPDVWARDRQYLRNDATEALLSFRAKREETLGLLRGLGPEQWERGGLHPTRGRMTAKDFAALMVGHDENHLNQLKRALEGTP